MRASQASFAERRQFLFPNALPKMREKLGPDHPDTLNCAHVLARAYRDNGHPKQALPLFEETLKLQSPKMGPGHPKTIITRLTITASSIKSRCSVSIDDRISPERS